MSRKPLVRFLLVPHRHGRSPSGWALLLLFAGLLQASVAGAQRKTITLDELVVEGNIQKPEAFFILPRTSLNYDGLDRRADLKSKILESVKSAPF